MEYKLIGGQIYKIVNNEEILLTQEELDNTKFKIVNGIPYELTPEEETGFDTRNTDYTTNCLDYSKNNKINLLREYTTSKIYTSYSLLKQIDIGNRINGYTDTNYNNMKAFIDSILIDYHTVKAQIEACNTIECVEAITFTF